MREAATTRRPETLSTRDPCEAVATSSPRPQLRAGDLVDGRLRIAGLLGRGGMSEVYAARELIRHRDAAVKLLRVDARDEAQQAIFTEARALLRVGHPSLIQLYGVGRMGTQPFLDLEGLLPGTLAERVLAGGGLGLGDFSQVMEQVAGAVDALHRGGFVHRDIKAENVLFRADGRAVLCDLGLAAEAGDFPLKDRAVVGTPAYMAPEVILGTVTGFGPWCAADQYALGVTAALVLTGSFPFASDSPSGMAYAHLALDPTPPSRLRPGVPPALDAVLLRVLAKQPEDRFASVEAFREALLAACAEALPGAARARSSRCDGEVTPVASSG